MFNNNLFLNERKRLCHNCFLIELDASLFNDFNDHLFFLEACYPKRAMTMIMKLH